MDADTRELRDQRWKLNTRIQQHREATVGHRNIVSAERLTHHAASIQQLEAKIVRPLRKVVAIAKLTLVGKGLRLGVRDGCREHGKADKGGSQVKCCVAVLFDFHGC